MPYIERGQDGKIKGVYARLQPGYAEEEIAEDDAAVVAFRNPPKLPAFVGRDLLAQLTPTDYAAVAAATTGNATFGLLWASLLGQGDAPILTNSPRFQSGWAALQQVLGAERAAAIASALGFG